MFGKINCKKGAQMKSIVQLHYEVNLSEINDLPTGFQVLQHDTQFKTYKVLQAHVDFFAANMQRFKYYLFKLPPLPKVTAYQTAEALAHISIKGNK